MLKYQIIYLEMQVGVPSLSILNLVQYHQTAPKCKSIYTKATPVAERSTEICVKVTEPKPHGFTMIFIGNKLYIL